MTIAEVARRAGHRLRDAGFATDEAAREIGVLARRWLGWDQARWFAQATTTPAPAAFAAGLDAWTARRAAREPSAYITREREFYGRTFCVSPAVLIPRPETEAVIDAALQVLPRLEGTNPTTPPLAVLDIGTGSGCLAVTLALERPDLAIVATDVSTAALAVAAGNALAHGVAARIDLRRAALAGGAAGRYDLIVANPPYVPTSDRHALAPEVGAFEPSLALFGGPDGLDVLRALIPAARTALRPSGQVICEIGAGQADAVRRLVDAADLHLLGIETDLAGISRVVIAGASPYNRAHELSLLPNRRG